MLPLERIPQLHVFYLGSSISIRISQVVGVFLITLNLPHLWRRRKVLLEAPWRWLTAFIFAAVLSAGTALSLNRGLLVAAYIVFVAVLAWTIAERVQIKALGKYKVALVVSATLACLFGFFQYFGNLAGLSNHLTGLLPRYTKDVFGFPRIQSTGYEPLYFANYLLIPFMLIMTNYLWRKRLYLPLVVLFTATFSLTLSRGAYAGLAVSVFLVLVLALRAKLFTRTAGLVIGVALGVALAVGMVAVAPLFSHKAGPVTTSDQAIATFTTQSTNTTSGNSIEDRTATRNTAIKAFQEHPWLGVGPGNFGLFAHNSWPAYFNTTDSVTNNEPLEILAEEGGLGIVIFLLFACDLAWWLWRRPATHGEVTLWRKALVIALIGIAVQYQTFSTLYITHLWVALGLLIGITMWAPKDKQHEAGN